MTGAPLPPVRVVSLVPSVTESLLAWGLEPVACTRFCEQPTLVHVGGTKDPDVAAIGDLAPDLVVMNDEENRREDADALVRAGIAIHTSSIHDVDDVWPSLVALAGACGLAAPPPWDLPSAWDGSARLTAFVPIWRRPWMTLAGSTYGSSLLARIGVANVFADAADRYLEVSLDDVAARRPDVVLAPTEPYPFAPRHAVELAAVAPMTLIDGQDLFWWGARTPAAMARLAAAVGSLAGSHDER